MSCKTIYVYHDKFQPPHLGNKIVWDAMKNKYGQENCFISVEDDGNPLNFKEKQSIFASMGIESSNVLRSEKPFSQIQIPSGFDPSKAIVIWIFQKENYKSIPSNIKPYTKTPEIGQSYYSYLPLFSAKQSNGQSVNLIGSDKINDQIIDFLGKSNDPSPQTMESFKKIFGFFDESLYKILIEKFKNRAESKTIKSDLLENILKYYKNNSTIDQKIKLSKTMGISLNILNSMIDH